MTTYYVEAYKPYNVVESRDEAEISSRFSSFEFEYTTVFLEWYTYDNDEINTAPYKLFVVVQPKSPLLHSVIINSVSIESSRGREYTFASSTTWPIVLDMTNGEERASHTFEPGFMFQFDEKEGVSTRIDIQILTENKVQQETIDVRWIPVRVKHFAPIV